MLVNKEYRLKSVSPMLMHNSQTVDPTNPFAKAIKAISGKRKKTDADYEEMSRLEFLAGLYMSKHDGPVIPAQNIRATLISAARKRREGKLAESGVFLLSHSVVEYDGPREPDEMWADGRFTNKAVVVVNRARIIRTRPIFEEWETTVNLSFDDEVLSEGQLDEWFSIAGHIIGIGDWRPQYGRFEVVTE